MISFDVKNLFTNVPLKDTVDIILTKVYDEKKIDTYTKVNIKRATVSLPEACVLQIQ